MTFSGYFQGFLCEVVKDDGTKSTHITGSPHIYVANPKHCQSEVFRERREVPASEGRARG